MKNHKTTLKNHGHQPKTMKNHGNQPQTMKNHETTLKNHVNQAKTMKNHETTLKNVTSLTGGPTDLLWCKKRDVTDMEVQLTSFGAKNVASLTGGFN